MTSPTGEHPAVLAASTGLSPARVSRGFSLLELILVLLILALGAALVAPTLGRFAAGRTSQDAAAHMLAVMQHASDQAVMTSTVFRVNFDEDASTYWLSHAPGGVDKRIETEAGRSFEMPDHMTFEVEGSQTLLENRYIQFEPDGSHEMAIIRIKPAQGSEIVIGCASPSEPYAIGQASQVQEAGSW